MKKSLARVLAIILLGAGLGLAANSLSPRGLSLIARSPALVPGGFITLDQAVLLWRAGGVLFLDAREPADYSAGHIGKALNLPAQSFAEHFGAVAPLLTPDTELILYGDGGKYQLSQALADRLRRQGYANLHILSNGWAGWREANLPDTRGNKHETATGSAH